MSSKNRFEARGHCDLWSLAPGAAARVAGHRAGLNEAWRQRLAEMGFHPGEVVTCVRRPALGAPRLYRVSNSVFSLDRALASQILISQS